MERLRQEIVTQRDMSKKQMDRETALEKQKMSNANQSWMVEQRRGERGMIPEAEERFGVTMTPGETELTI